MNELAHLRILRESVSDGVLCGCVEASLGGGVYAYVAALIRLVEDGDRDPAVALNEARSAVGFLTAVPRLPDARPRQWSPQ